jgi:hypothetical protein
MYYVGKLTSIKDNIMMCLNTDTHYNIFVGSVVYIYKRCNDSIPVAKGILFEVSKVELKILLLQGLS